MPVDIGGDDFGEHFSPQTKVFAHILASEDDLELSASATHLSLKCRPTTAPPSPDRSALPRRPMPARAGDFPRGPFMIDHSSGNYSFLIGPGYCAMAESCVTRSMPSAIAWATRSRSNGSLW
ncbi:DUF3085 domain-containing protein [Pseudomonas citronellolis]|nr:DUF3085 domain-containing protein [Pseudomonas citronellolis]